MIENTKINCLIEEFNNNVNSHAYIFYTNDLRKCKDDVFLLCEKLFDTDDLKRITNDFIFLDSENKKNILKEDLLFIKNSFLNKSYMNKYRIYLIEEAQKLNDSSSNVILKFLEEPEEGIVGFFITTELDSVIPTIKSRCQIINCFYDLDDVVNENDYKIIDTVFLKKPCYNIFEFKKNNFDKIERNELINIFKGYLNKCYEIGLNSEKECKKILILNNVITKLINNVNIDYVLDYLLLESSEI